jgi:hypothetical protein
MKFIKWLNKKINESMDVRVKDAKYENPMETLGDLSWYLTSKLNTFLNSFSKEQKEYFNKNRTPEIIAPDGPGSDHGQDYYFQNSGILNVYLSSIPVELIDKFKQAISYYLKEAGVEFGQTSVNKSNVYGSDVLRIPILKMSPPKENPPELNMSNANAHHIFSNVLGFKDVGNGFLIPARELLIKIDNYDEDMADLDARLDTVHQSSEEDSECSSGKCPRMISFGLSGNQIRQRLEIIRNIAKWAIDNNYDEIQVF